MSESTTTRRGRRRHAPVRDGNHPMMVAAVIAGYRAASALHGMSAQHGCRDCCEESEGCEDGCWLGDAGGNLGVFIGTCIIGPLSHMLRHDDDVEEARLNYLHAESQGLPPFESDWHEEAVFALLDLLDAIQRLGQTPDLAAAEHTDALGFVVRKFTEILDAALAYSERVRRRWKEVNEEAAEDDAAFLARMRATAAKLAT